MARRGGRKEAGGRGGDGVHDFDTRQQKNQRPIARKSEAKMTNKTTKKTITCCGMRTVSCRTKSATSHKDRFKRGIVPTAQPVEGG